MKAHDSLGFFVVGQVMAFLPALAPAYFPPGATDGINTSELWLEVMGMVTNLIGAGIIVRLIPAALKRRANVGLPAAEVGLEGDLLHPNLVDPLPDDDGDDSGDEVDGRIAA